MTLYGIAEIAAALGARRQTVAQWYARGKLPEPDARLSMGPVWTSASIEGWIAARDASAPPSAQPQARAASVPVKASQRDTATST